MRTLFVPWLRRQPAGSLTSINENFNKKQSKIATQLEQIWDSLVMRFEPSRELRIWSWCDRAGNTWWSAHDPLTGRSIKRVSEAEVRVWVEQRHHLSKPLNTEFSTSNQNQHQQGME